VFFVSNHGDHSENFRTEIAAKLFDRLPQDQLRSVLAILDATLPEYEISRRPVEIIPADGIPDVVRYYLASKAVENLSPGTLHIYRLRLIDFFSRIGKPIHDIRATDIRLYLFYCKDQRHASDSYLDNIRRILSAFFSWLVDNEYLLRNPCATVEKIKHQPPVREPLTAYELEELRWSCQSIREKALVDFLYSTGIRVSECRDVDIADVDFVSRSVVIRHGKGDKRRTVFFNAESELTLRKYLATRSDDCPSLFVTDWKPARRMCVKALENIITKASARTGLHVYPHKLRHTFATSGLRGGMPLDKLQALMGHAKPETTLIYAKEDRVDLQREHMRVYA